MGTADTNLIAKIILGTAQVGDFYSVSDNISYLTDVIIGAQDILESFGIEWGGHTSNMYALTLYTNYGEITFLKWDGSADYIPQIPTPR